MKKWSIRYTGRPFGPCEPLHDEDFRHEYGRYETLRAAQQALEKLGDQERSAWGQNAWGDHNTIMPLTDTQMVVRFQCGGCGETVEHKYLWRAETREPEHPDFCTACQRRLDQMTPDDADFDLFYDSERNNPYEGIFPFATTD